MKWVLIAIAVLIVYFLVSRTIKKAKRNKAAERIATARNERISEELKDAVSQDDVPQLVKCLNGMQSQELEEMIAWYTERDDAVDKARNWVAQDPDNLILKSVLGVSLVNLAWKVRGGAVASKLSTSQVLDFSVLLQEGKDLLRKVLDADGSIPIVYTALINAALGSSDRELAWSVFEKLRQNYPAMFTAHAAMALSLTPKWGGSASDLLNFCREVVAKDTTGKLSGLVAFAHNEVLMDLAMKRDMKGYMDYFKDDKVRDEIMEAYRKTEDIEPDSDLYASLNQFAGIYTQMSEKKQARKVFERIGDHCSKTPWHYESAENPVDAFLAAKQKAGVPV